MDSYLVATKIRVPPQPRQALGRPRLGSVLDREVPVRRLVMVSAPAGYGKTTLLADWGRRCALPLAWLTLGAEDDDPVRFLRYLLAAWAQVRSGVMDGPLGVLLEARTPPVETLLATIVNVTSEEREHVGFVLDDYHMVSDPAIHRAVAFLLDRAPPTLHIVIAGRSRPPLPLARYRARNESLEIGIDELRFTVEEAREFLLLRTGRESSHDDLRGLHARLEGWFAGLHLWSLTAARHPDTVDGRTVTGRTRFIADFFREEIWEHLSDEVRTFLLRTSILDRLSSDLCDDVTGLEGSQDMLERLERENLFLLPLDDRRSWFRYHGLFAEALRAELDRAPAEAVDQLHRRAARWYLANDMPEEAIRHAVAADDLQVGVLIGERYLEIKLLSGEFRLLRRWLDALPASWYAAYPSFGLIRVGVLMFTGAFDEGIRSIDEIERSLASGGPDRAGWHRARVAAIRCSIACVRHDLVMAEQHARMALADLPDDDHAFRANIHHSLGDSYRRSGRWLEAEESYRRVLELVNAPTYGIRCVHVLGGLADLEVRQGRLRAAAHAWRRALAALEQPGVAAGTPLPLLGWIHIRLAEILYEWNELEEAEALLARGLERAELGGDVRVILAGLVATTRLRSARGEVPAAQAALARAQSIASDVPDAEWSSRLSRCRLELLIARDELRAAADLAEDLAQGIDRPLDDDVAQLTLTRALISRGDAEALERALTLLRPLLAAAEAQHRSGLRIEVGALQALTRWRRGDRPGALTALVAALRVAEPEGYIRAFVDLGMPMARLLQWARGRDVMRGYIERLLAAFAALPPSPTGLGGALPEPLTPREREVLAHVAVGLLNREIADVLGVSPETVKKHVANICEKLGVGTRTAAAARARELRLLDG